MTGKALGPLYTLALFERYWNHLKTASGQDFLQDMESMRQ